MTVSLKQGDEAFCLPNCLHEQMVHPVLTVPVLEWLVRPATTSADDEASCMLQHLRQKHALYGSAICSNMLAFVEFKII
jgi:hypothetical protein